MTYKTIEEVRAALYPGMVRLLKLDPSEHIAWWPLSESSRDRT